MARAPQYLVEDCQLVAAADRRQLRSSDTDTLYYALVSVIGHFQLLDQGCGTAFRPTYDNLALPSIVASGVIETYLFG